MDSGNTPVHSQTSLQPEILCDLSNVIGIFAGLLLLIYHKHYYLLSKLSKVRYKNRVPFKLHSNFFTLQVLCTMWLAIMQTDTYKTWAREWGCGASGRWEWARKVKTCLYSEAMCHSNVGELPFPLCPFPTRSPNWLGGRWGGQTKIWSPKLNAAHMC